MKDFLVGIAPARGWGETWAEIERGAVRDIIPNDTGRFGKPEEIAAAVAYLSSPLAGYVSSANLRVDGGLIRNVT
ncbi:SDR family oxidoreductase [Amycolatopsis sp. NPDC051372]|uniref:SDR family oxidoreductase n=1 Tax=Amycolatopsis sp. NPDC051372 TaxID=3155669 RepID=UPI00342C91AA